MNPSPITGLVERLRAAVTYADLPMAVRKLLSEAAEALSLPLPTPTVDREAIARVRHALFVATDYGSKPLPWVMQSGCSYRRIGCETTGGDGDVLQAVTQRSDGHLDLSMPERQLTALVEVINALPAILALLHPIDDISETGEAG